MLCDAIPSAVMPKKADEPTEQINFRFKKSTVKRMRAYANAHPLQPTLTMVAEAAVVRFLNEEEPNLPKPSKQEKS
jgi:hypothetical protein